MYEVLQDVEALVSLGCMENVHKLISIVVYQTVPLEVSMNFLSCLPMGALMDIMWPASQSHFHLLFIFIEMKFYSLSFLCDCCNEVYQHIQ